MSRSAVEPSDAFITKRKGTGSDSNGTNVTSALGPRGPTIGVRNSGSENSSRYGPATVTGSPVDKWFSNCAWASLPSGVSGNENFIGTIIGGVSGDLGDTDNSP